MDSTLVTKDKDYGFFENTVYFKGELERFTERGIRESHAYPDHYMPIYNSLKKIFPDILLLSYEGCQFIFRRNKVQNVHRIIRDRKNIATQKMEVAIKAYYAISDLLSGLIDREE